MNKDVKELRSLKLDGQLKQAVDTLLSRYDAVLKANGAVAANARYNDLLVKALAQAKKAVDKGDKAVDKVAVATAKKAKEDFKKDTAKHESGKGPKPATPDVEKIKDKVVSSANSSREDFKKITAIAKEIRRSDESWRESVSRARGIFNEAKKEKEKSQRDNVNRILEEIKNSAEYKALRGKSKTEVDAARPAKKPGYRISANGKKYMETRMNRSDVRQGNYPLLKKGGLVANSRIAMITHSNSALDGSKQVNVILSLANGGSAEFMVEEFPKGKWCIVKEDGVLFKGKLESEKAALDYIYDFYKVNERKYKAGGKVATSTFSLIPWVSVGGSATGMINAKYDAAKKVNCSYSEAVEAAKEMFDEGNYEKVEIIKQGATALKSKMIGCVTDAGVKKYADGGITLKDAEGGKRSYTAFVKGEEHVLVIQEIKDGIVGFTIDGGRMRFKPEAKFKEFLKEEEFVSDRYKDGGTVGGYDFSKLETLKIVQGVKKKDDSKDVPLTTYRAVKMAKGGRVKTIKESDITEDSVFELANGETIRVKRLFIENGDEQWCDFTRLRKEDERQKTPETKQSSVNQLKNFINNWRPDKKFEKGGELHGSIDNVIGYEIFKEAEKSFIKTNETFIDSDYEPDDVEYNRTKAYKPVYQVCWQDYVTNGDPDIRLFDKIDDAFNFCQSAGQYWNETQNHYKNIIPLFQEVILNSDGTIYEETDKTLVGDDFIRTKEGKLFAEKAGISDFNNWVLYEKDFGSKHENSNDGWAQSLLAETQSNLGKDLEGSYVGASGQLFKVEVYRKKDKYETIKIFNTEEEEINSIKLRISDHRYNPRNNDDFEEFISVEISNDNPTKHKFHGSEYLSYNGLDTYDKILSDVKGLIEMSLQKFEKGGELKEKPTINGLTLDEAMMLVVKRSISQPYRAEKLRPAGLENTERAKAAIEGLKTFGYVNAGGAITAKGMRVAKDQFNSVSDQMWNDYFQKSSYQLLKSWEWLQHVWEYRSKGNKGPVLLKFSHKDMDTTNFFYKGTDQKWYISVEGVIHETTDQREPNVPAKDVFILVGEPIYNPDDRYGKNVGSLLQKYKKGGLLKDKADYVPNRMIHDLTLTLNGEYRKLKGTDIDDGVYVLKKYKPLVKKNDAAKIEKEIRETMRLNEAEISPLLFSDNKILKLLAAGYNEQDIKIIYLGYGLVFKDKIVCDNEFASYIGGLGSFGDDYIERYFQRYLDAAKNNVFEMGVKYPHSLNWSKIVKKYKIDLTPKIIITPTEIPQKGSFNYQYHYETFSGPDVMFGKVIKKGRWVTKKNNEYWDLNENEGDPTVGLNFEAGYWGFVSHKKEVLLDIANMLVTQKMKPGTKSDNHPYIKDLEMFINGLGGLDFQDLKKGGVKFKKGGVVSHKHPCDK